MQVKNEASSLFAIRPFNAETDRNFVYDSWLKSVHNLSPCNRIRAQDFFPAHRSIIDQILSSPETNILIAHPHDDSDQILGYIVTEGEVVHFVLVKIPFQKMGIGRALLNASGVNQNDMTITHWTFAMNAIVFKFDNVRYNPYLIYQRSRP